MIIPYQFIRRARRMNRKLRTTLTYHIRNGFSGKVLTLTTVNRLNWYWTRQDNFIRARRGNIWVGYSSSNITRAEHVRLAQMGYKLERV